MLDLFNLVLNKTLFGGSGEDNGRVSSVIIPPSNNEMALLGKSVGLILGNEYTVTVDIVEDDGTTRQETKQEIAYQEEFEGIGLIDGTIVLGTFDDDYSGYMFYDFCGISDDGEPTFNTNECIYQTGEKVTQITITGEFAENPDTRLKDFIEGNLTELVDDTITTVSSHVFSNNNTIQTVILPNCISVGGFAFSSCKTITNVDLPSCENLGSQSFIYCTALSNANLPNCISLGEYAFKSCSALVNIDLPSCETLKKEAFSECSKLTNIVLPKCTTVNEKSFYNCKALERIELSSVESIGIQAFYSCGALTTLIIRNTSVIPTIQSNTFSYSAVAQGKGTIYVPDNLVEDYKVASVWSTYADQIKPLSELT